MSGFNSSIAFKLVFTVYALTICHQAVNGQAWREGYIIKNNGDSLRGQIEFADPNSSTAQIGFRSGSASPTSTFNTTEITSFGLLDPAQRYDRLQAELIYYSKLEIEAGTNPVVGRRKVDAFAEVVRAGGDVVLYSVYDDARDERFFLKRGTQLTELKHASYLVLRNSVSYKMEDNGYIDQINALLSDCPGAGGKAYKYDSRSLGRAIDTYLACHGELNTSFGSKDNPTLMIGGYILLGKGAKNSASEIAWAGTFGINVQALSRKNRGNQFVWMDIGLGNADILAAPIHFALSAGSYFGQGRIQPLIDIGASTLKGTFNAGAGLGYEKRIVLAVNYNTSLFLEEAKTYTFKLMIYPRIRFKS